MTRDLDAVLASIDGALADDEFPDAMRWSPEPASVDAPHPFDGETVYVGPEERYEEVARPAGSGWFTIRDGVPRELPSARGLVPDLVIVDDPFVEHRPDCSIVHEYVDRPPACQCGALDRAALTMPRVHRTPFDGFASAVAAAQQHEAALAAVRRLFADMGEALRPIVETFGRRAEETGKGLAEVVEEFRRQYDAVRAVGQPILDGLRAPVDTSLRDTDPAAYALQARQSRGTGPDRQVQRQHRPRCHR